MNEPAFTFDWFSQNIPALTQVLAKFKGRPNVHALEIGCFEGRGTLWLLTNILTDKVCSLMCVDTFEGSAEHAHLGMSSETLRLKFQENIGNDSRVSLIIRKSQDALKGLWPGTEFDIIYIDGSHIASDVLTDLVLSWPLLKQGGVMFMDDFEWPGTDGNPLHKPKPAILAFLDIYAEGLKVLHRGYSVAIEKI